jgi:MFS family permease
MPADAAIVLSDLGEVTGQDDFVGLEDRAGAPVTTNDPLAGYSRSGLDDVDPSDPDSTTPEVRHGAARSVGSAARGAGRSARRVARWSGGRVEHQLGGPERTRVIVVLAGVLAMSSADTATIGASATQLRAALHITNTDIGLLVTVTAVVGAVAAVPFGVLADRTHRTRTLGASIVVWGVAMVASATVSSFEQLLLARLFLGLVTASAGPVVASLIGDYFPSAERGKIYGYVLTGELLGAGFGFAVTGDIATVSWRAAFVALALPTFVLARYVFSTPEPARGGVQPLFAETSGQPSTPVDAASGPDEQADAPPGETDAQRLARERGVDIDPDLVIGPDARSMSLTQATRYILRVPTNVTLILASACGYFYLAGIQTFAVEFTKQQYRINQVEANFLLLVLGAGAVVGVLVAGRLSDGLLRRRYLNARITVTTIAAVAAAGLFIPALLTRRIAGALPYLVLAAFMLSAQNPPIDAARLDIMPWFMWGRAEGVRTALRTAAQALAPLAFGITSDYIFGGGRAGLQWTFLVMLAPLGANAYFLFRSLRTYPRDVATAAASQAPPPPAQSESPEDP